MSVAAAEPIVSRFPVAPRRTVSASMLTEMGWIRGELVLPRPGLIESLNARDGVLRLRGVALTGLLRPLRSLALARDACSLVIPREPEDGLDPGGAVQDWRRRSVSCVFRRGWISGVLTVRRALRVSDYLGESKHFFVLHDCVYSSGSAESRFSYALVNASRLVGLTEPSIERARLGLGSR